MIFRLKTSKETEEILLDMKNKHNLTPNILSRLAVALSLREEPLTKEYIEMMAKKTENNGIEFQRHTLTGENEVLYKVLMENYCQSHLTDEEFFPLHFKFHLENGIKKLRSETEISNSLENLIKNLMKY